MFAANESAIIARLQAVLGPTVHVGALRDLERVKELRQKAPACWVIYDGYNPGEYVPPGTIQQVVQDWFVVVATRSARGNGEVDDARDQNSALCDQVLGALLGYHLGGGKYLRLAPAPGPEYDAGYVHTPLAFQSSATFKGQP